MAAFPERAEFTRGMNAAHLQVSKFSGLNCIATQPESTLKKHYFAWVHPESSCFGYDIVLAVDEEDAYERLVIGDLCCEYETITEDEYHRRQARICSVCGESQFDSPSGLVCNNGHGGAPTTTFEEFNARGQSTMPPTEPTSPPANRLIPNRLRPPAAAGVDTTPQAVGGAGTVPSGTVQQTASASSTPTTPADAERSLEVLPEDAKPTEPSPDEVKQQLDQLMPEEKPAVSAAASDPAVPSTPASTSLKPANRLAPPKAVADVATPIVTVDPVTKVETAITPPPPGNEGPPLLEYYLQIMFYGQGGVGKTTLIGTVTEDLRLMPALMLDVDRSTESIRSKCRYLTKIEQLGNPEPGKIDVLAIPNWDQLQKAYEWLFDDRYERKRRTYQTVIIDTLTECHYMALEKVASLDPKRVKDFDVPDLSDYNHAQAFMKRTIRALRDIDDLHKIFTAHPKLFTSASGNISMIKPSFQGQLADEVAAIVPIIGYMEVEGADHKRVVQFQPRATVLAKDRTEGGLLSAKLVNPTLTTILDLITKSKAKTA